MPSIFETLANASADFLHSQSLNAERAETIRAAILKQWKERDEPKAKHLAETTGIGTYKMIFEYEPALEKEEFAQLIPDELKDVPADKGSVFVWWGAHAPSKYEIHLNFDKPRNLRLRELKEQAQQEKKEPVEVFREFDTSITYIRCPNGYHFIDDEGHIARNQKRARVEDDKSGAEKKRDDVQMAGDYIAKEEAALAESVAEGVAVKRVRIENLHSFRAWEIMIDGLEGCEFNGFPTNRCKNKQELALRWEKALLKDPNNNAHQLFRTCIKQAEDVDALDDIAKRPHWM